MRNIVGILVFVIALPAHGFDFHGIRSGMRKEEVSEVAKQLGASISRDGTVTIGDKGLSGMSPSPESITPAYDNQGHLYQLNLVYHLYDVITKGLRYYSDPERKALKLALEEKYQATVLQEKVRYYVEMVDQEMLDNYISYLKSIYIDSL